MELHKKRLYKVTFTTRGGTDHIVFVSAEGFGSAMEVARKTEYGFCVLELTKAEFVGHVFSEVEEHFRQEAVKEENFMKAINVLNGIYNSKK